MAATTWGVGHYQRMAERLDAVAAEIVERVAPAAGEATLDVACGTGNAALHAARRGARVVGVDFEPRLLEVAAERAHAEGLRVEWREGDASALPVEDHAADVVLSVFGVMYAPDQPGAAAELARVCVPGARVGLVAWVPGSLLPAMGAALAPYLPPPPPGSASPARWGDDEPLAGLLAAAGLEMRESDRRMLDLRFADSDEAVAFLVDTAGHVLAERERLMAAGGWDEMLTDLESLVDERATPAPGGGGIVLAAEYLLALAHARA